MDETPNNATVAPSLGSAESPKLPTMFAGGTFIDLNQEIVRLQTDAPSKEETGHKSKMLVKYPEFRIVLIAMRVGSRWEDHKTSARIFIHVLRGHIRFHTPDGTFDLRPGQLLTLDPSVLHSVDAPEESAFLLTLSDPDK